MSSPENTATDQDPTVSRSTVRRSRKPVRVIGGLLAVVLVTLTFSACNPKVSAKDAIARYWGRHAACAERIVQRESGFQSAIRNPSSGTIGLFQLHPTHKAWVKRTFGYEWNELTDPYKNAKVAKGLSDEAYRYYKDGFQPWRLSGRTIRGGGCPA